MLRRQFKLKILLKVPATDLILKVTILFYSCPQCGILSCGCLEMKKENLRFYDLKIPLFQACPDQKLSLSRSETVQIRVVHCIISYHRHSNINDNYKVDWSLIRNYFLVASPVLQIVYNLTFIGFVSHSSKDKKQKINIYNLYELNIK